MDTVPASKTVCIWSDRPASQFKNRLIAAAIPVFKAKHQLTFKWNFFATSHGKGPVNGIGGSVKRDVWMQVKNEKQSSQMLFVAAASELKNVSESEMDQMEIDPHLSASVN